jgi:hypothetical protein
MASQYLARLGHGTSTDKLLLSGAGSLGLLAATTAFFTQKTSGLQPGRLLIYGVMFELGRRAWDWSYPRFTWGALESVHDHIATVMTDVSSRNEGYCDVHAGRSRVRVGHASSGEFACQILHVFKQPYTCRRKRGFGNGRRILTSQSNPLTASGLCRCLTESVRSRVRTTSPNGSGPFSFAGTDIGSTSRASTVVHRTSISPGSRQLGLDP